MSTATSGSLTREWTYLFKALCIAVLDRALSDYYVDAILFAPFGVKCHASRRVAQECEGQQDKSKYHVRCSWNVTAS
ncbi:MAG: hypothetical protein WBW73_23595 [Rhodoplanes sp.]